MATRICLGMLVLVVAVSQGFAGQNVVVVLDDSGSMQEVMQGGERVRKINAAKSALLFVLDHDVVSERPFEDRRREAVQSDIVRPLRDRRAVAARAHAQIYVGG